MMIEDLETMNEMERKTYVLKKNVWPALNYSYMRENGVTAQADIAIKYIKDSINVTPNYQHHLTTKNTTPEIEYIRAISTIRDEMSKVNTLDDFKEACINLLNVGRGDKKDSIYGHSPFQVTIGYDTCNLLSSAEYRRSWDIDAPTMIMVPDHWLTNGCMHWIFILVSEKATQVNSILIHKKPLLENNLTL